MLRFIKSISNTRSLCTIALFCALIVGVIFKSMLLQIIFAVLTVIYYGNYLLYKDLYLLSQERLKELEDLYDEKCNRSESEPKKNVKKTPKKKS